MRRSDGVANDEFDDVVGGAEPGAGGPGGMRQRQRRRLGATEYRRWRRRSPRPRQCRRTTASTNPSASFTVLQSASLPAVSVDGPPKVNFTVFSDGAVKTGLTLADMSFATRQAGAGQATATPTSGQNYVSRKATAAPGREATGGSSTPPATDSSEATNRSRWPRTRNSSTTATATTPTPSLPTSPIRTGQRRSTASTTRPMAWPSCRAPLTGWRFS